MLHLMLPVRAAHTQQGILEDPLHLLRSRLSLVDLDTGDVSCLRWSHIFSFRGLLSCRCSSGNQAAGQGVQLSSFEQLCAFAHVVTFHDVAAQHLLAQCFLNSCVGIVHIYHYHYRQSFRI